MPQKQHHRGKHPQDARLFTPKWVPTLRNAARDLSWLLSRRYAGKAALKLVGDHYQLTLRQRRAVLGASCADTSLDYRRTHAVETEDLAGEALDIDGYNVLIAVECALSGGILLRGRDGCIRDLASVHGSYHKVEETLAAVHLIGRTLERLAVGRAHWYFDAPVSNSGRLKTLLRAEAAQAGWDWHVELAANPDKLLAASSRVVATADGWILDRAARWTNLTAAIIRYIEPLPDMVDLNVADAAASRVT